MNVFTAIAKGVSSLFGQKDAGGIVSQSDFYDPEDNNGSTSFFRNRDALSPADHYNGW